jgi:(p)ppGpp synthase/HD superfamily hydrolase
MKPEDVTQEFLWSRLQPHLGHLSLVERDVLQRALAMAMHAHKGQLRKSGEPFITHPVEVTVILAEMSCELVRRLQLQQNLVKWLQLLGHFAIRHSHAKPLHALLAMHECTLSQDR